MRRLNGRTHCALRRGLTLLRAPLLAALAWLAMVVPARAAILDEPESLTEGSDAVVRVHFDVRVQYQRHTPTGTADLVEVYFQIIGASQTPTPAVEEQVTTPEHGRVPAVTISFPVQPQPSATAPVKKIIVRFASKVAFRVRGGPTDQSIDIVFPGLAGVAPPVSGAAGAVEKDRYAITLQTVPLDHQDELRPVPGRFQDYTVFTTRGWRGGAAVVELDLGYFDTQADADKVRQSALREFPEATVFDAIERKEQNLAKAAEGPPAAPPAPEAPPPPPPPPVVQAPVPQVAPMTEAAPPAPEAPDTEIDKQARALLERARSALSSGKNDEAISLLNQLLLLPPNKFSQEAQELIGVARERAGQNELARKEYELYLKLFPNGEGATRVRQRLASLAPPPAQESTEATTAQAPPQGAKYGLTGSFAQYYYGGQTQVNTSFLNTPTTANQQTLTSTSQSSLVSTVNLNGRYQDGSNDARFVVYDTNDKSFIGGAAPGTNRLDSAYVDYRNTSYGFTAKVGRQAGVTGGLIGRFDGAIVGYDLSPQWRINVTGGVPVDTIVNSNQNFEGFYLEGQNLGQHWSGDAFFMNQMADGLTDRRAVGGDVRYFDEVRTLYTMLDYDINFNQLNAVTVQGTWQLPDQTSFSLLFDDRKAPELLTSNALLSPRLTNLSPPITTLSQATQVFSESELRDFAKDITANSKQVSLSVTRPVFAKWQATADVRLTNVGALPAITVQSTPGVSNTIPQQSGTGNVYTYDLIVSGTNLYSLRDVNSFVLSHLNGPQFSGNQFGYNNLTGLFENRMTLEPSLQYYIENDSNGNRLTRITPALRATYKLLKHLSIESQFLYERSKTDGRTQNDTTSNGFYYIGYRYTFE
jgi:tetratricopeptide (TPR) repeat protein